MGTATYFLGIEAITPSPTHVVQKYVSCRCYYCYHCSFCPMTGCCSDFLRPNAKPLKKLFKTTPADPTHLTTALMAAVGLKFFSLATPNWNVSVVSLACTRPHVRIRCTHCVFYTRESRNCCDLSDCVRLRCCYFSFLGGFATYVLSSQPSL